jgi:hypothetical protein
VTLNISCPASVTVCKGRVTLRTFRQTLRRASGLVSIIGGQRKAVKLHLTKQDRRLLKRDHVLRIRVTLVVHDPAGRRHTTRRILTLHAKT